MKRPILLALVVLAMLLPAPGIGQDKPADGMQALRAAVHVDKRGYVASSLALTEGEAKRFWPIYDAYQRQLDLSNRRRSVALVEVDDVADGGHVGVLDDVLREVGCLALGGAADDADGRPDLQLAAHLDSATAGVGDTLGAVLGQPHRIEVQIGVAQGEGAAAGRGAGVHHDRCIAVEGPR